MAEDTSTYSGHNCPQHPRWPLYSLLLHHHSSSASFSLSSSFSSSTTSISSPPSPPLSPPTPPLPFPSLPRPLSFRGTSSWCRIWSHRQISLGYIRECTVYTGTCSLYMTANVLSIALSALFHSNLALGIGIQNFPEGLAVSLPLRAAGTGTWKSFWYVMFWDMLRQILAPPPPPFLPLPPPSPSSLQVWSAQWYGGALGWFVWCCSNDGKHWLQQWVVWIFDGKLLKSVDRSHFNPILKNRWKRLFQWSIVTLVCTRISSYKVHVYFFKIIKIYIILILF